MLNRLIPDLYEGPDANSVYKQRKKHLTFALDRKNNICIHDMLATGITSKLSTKASSGEKKMK